MKKIKFFIPFVALGLALSGCESASALQENFTDADFAIDTKWEDFVMPAREIEFKEGEESIELNKGEKHTYTYTISPRGATSNSLTWESTDESVAKVEDGVVTAIGPGETTIIVNSLDSTLSATELSVKVNVPLTSFNLDVPNRLDWNETYEFDVSYEPVDTTYTDLSYEIINASPEGVASVNSSGAVTTYGFDGTATLKVTSSYLGATHAKEFALNIQTIPVTSVVVSGENEVEINHSVALHAAVTPTNASDLVKKGVKFYSRDSEIATVDEVTGTVSGVSTGTARIYAKVGETLSSDYEVTVYKVLATSVAFTTTPFTLTNHGENASLSKQLEWTITTDRLDHEEPSSATIRFESSDETVATVDNNGLVSAIGPGSASISIIIEQDGQADVTASVNLTVNLVSTALSISGGTSFYNDESLTLTATLIPANVSDNTVNWDLEPATGVATLSSNTGSSITLTADNPDATGSVTVTATNVNGASNSVTINVAERNADFTSGQHYIVGNNLFNTGESRHVDGKSSWSTPKYAYHFTNRTSNSSDLEEYKGTIHFAAGDEFRYRYGEVWIDAYEQHDGWAEPGYHIENSGALTDGSMKYVKENPETHITSDSTDPDANIYVIEEGWYDIYAKLYKKSDGSIWNGLYIEKVPHMTSELYELTMGPTDTYQIVLHDYIGQVNYGVTSSAPIDVSDTGLITAKAEGDSTVVIHDARMDEVLIDVHVRENVSGVSRIIYLNTNGKLDTGSPSVPFVHSWKQGGEGPAVDTKMTKVGGQNIVYEAAIPTDHNYVVFVNSKQENFDWAEIHGQTVDLALEVNKDMFKPTGVSDGKFTGEWSVFDSGKVYEKDMDPPYIQYMKAGNWAFAQLVEDPGNSSQYKYDAGLALEADAEFVIRVSQGDWRHWSNFNAGGSSNKIVQGTNDTQNFKASVAGTFNFFVKKNAADDEGHNVYITEAGPTTYTVSFDSNGGTGTMASVPDQSGTYMLPDCLFTAPSGQQFAGWKANNEGVMLDAGSPYDLTAAVTFYAQWETAHVANNVTLYLTANWSGFESPKAYVFDSSTDTPYAVWPGEDMTYVGINDDNDTIFSYTVDIGLYDRIVFANGGAGDKNQTVDIDISSAKTGDAFFFSGRVGGDDNAKIECGTWDYTNAALTSKQVVYISNSEYWSDSKVYIFNSSTHAEATSWDTRGAAKWVANNELGQEVFRVVIDTSLYNAFILTGRKDDNDKQTIDILLSSLTEGHNAFYVSSTQDGSGHYEVGQWTYSR